MPTGTVRWFNDLRGFGFIQPDAGGKDLFIHRKGITSILRSGYKTLEEGDKVTYDIIPGHDGKQQADNVIVDNRADPNKDASDD